MWFVGSKGCTGTYFRKVSVQKSVVSLPKNYRFQSLTESSEKRKSSTSIQPKKKINYCQGNFCNLVLNSKNICIDKEEDYDNLLLRVRESYNLQKQGELQNLKLEAQVDKLLERRA